MLLNTFVKEKKYACQTNDITNSKIINELYQTITQ